MNSRVQQIFKRLLASLVVMSLVLTSLGTIHPFAALAEGFPPCGAKILVPDSVSAKASQDRAKGSVDQFARAAIGDIQDKSGDSSPAPKCCSPFCAPLAAFSFDIRGLNILPPGRTLDFRQRLLREVDKTKLKRPPRNQPSSMMLA